MRADMISQRSGGARAGSGVQLGTGRGTLRLRAKGPATVEELVSGTGVGARLAVEGSVVPLGEAPHATWCVSVIGRYEPF